MSDLGFLKSILRVLGNICDRIADYKQPLGLVKLQYIPYEKKMTN